MSASTIISALRQAVDLEKLTDEQLQKLSCSDAIRSGLGDLADVMEGIGCLVAEDGDTGSAGNFQSSHDVPPLLFGLANAVRASAEALLVANDAAFELQQRAEAKAKRSKKGDQQ